MTYEATNNRDTSGDLLLTLGIDGSGKSTFLSGLQNQLGTLTYEQTTSSEARRFKEKHLGARITTAFIREREDMFLRLNGELEAGIQEEVDNGRKVATSGGKLITLVSHQLMRVMIGEGHPRSIEQTVTEWLDDEESLKPDRIALIHAPDFIIKERIIGRQQAGDKTEAFIGFNALSFLRRYQDTWHETVDILDDVSEIPHIKLDSSVLSPQEMIDVYAGFSRSS